MLASIDLEADAIAPVTTVSGADALWHNKPVTLTFTAGDNPGGPGVDYTEFKLDAGDWTKGASVTVPAPANHSGDGVHTVAYRSADKADNVEVAKSCQVKIDTTPPTVRAQSLVCVRHRKVVVVRFLVRDALSPSAVVSITLTPLGHLWHSQPSIVWSGTVPADGSQQKASLVSATREAAATAARSLGHRPGRQPASGEGHRPAGDALSAATQLSRRRKP